MTYFRIHNNTNININDSNLKLELNFKNVSNQICSFSLLKYLIETKKKIDSVSYLWGSVKIYTNPFEFIHTNVPNTSLSVSKYKPISRAFFKLLEIYNLFNILDYDRPINTFHLAEGPGGFIEATMFLRNNKKDNYYGMTLIDKNNSVPGWKKSKNFLEKFQNINLEGGLDGTGNLFNEENFKYCSIKYGNSLDIITGDGGIDFSDDYNDQENLASRLIITQIFYALSMQKIGGTFILKMFDVFNKCSVDAIYLLSLFYKKVYVVKPYTSRYANSEKYIVCLNFAKPLNKPIKIKFWSILKILKSIDFNTYNISSILDIKQNLYFMNNIEEINIILGQRQIENILFTIKMIKNKDKYNERIAKFKSNNIQRCIKWCENNNIETNKFKDIISPKNIFLKN
jgi:23S rRNA U2552 (ribose-2'-O)-methylase RlmE/FtsJ